MPSRSRPSSPVSREKPYDQPSSEESSDEDFVNASVTPPASSGRPASATGRPSSRASAASGASRASRRSNVRETSSSESIDSEEERELAAELQDAAGTETGVVRGAPVETVTERVMRSVGKSSNSAQRYASIGEVEAGSGSRRSGSQRSSSRRHQHHRSGSGRRKEYSVGTAAAAGTPKKRAALVADPEGGAPPQARSKKRIACYVLGGIILLLLIAAIVVAVVLGVRSKNNSAEDADTSSSTSLADHDNSTDTSLNSTLSRHSTASVTELPTGDHPALGSTATYNDGKYHASTGTAEATTALETGVATYNDGQYHPSSAAAATVETGHSEHAGVESMGLNSGSVETASEAFGAHSQVGDGGMLGSETSPVAATPTQVYGFPSTDDATATSAQPSVGTATGSDLFNTVSIQTVPNPEQTDSALSPLASNGGPWNALSDAAQATQQNQQGQQGATVAPGQAQPTPGQVVSSSSLQFGVGPVETAQKGAPAAAPAGASGLAGWGNGDAASATQPAAQATASPTANDGAWNAGEADSETTSPIDSTVPGPFTSGDARQATQPEAFQTYVNAQATWYESSGHYGPCGVAVNNTDYVVAINNAIWLNSTQGSPTTPSTLCGAEVLLTSMTDGSTVNAWVTDRCAFCSAEDAGSIDLSKAAFSAISGGSTDAGSLQIVWGFTGNYSSAVTSASATASTSGQASTETEQDGGDDSSSGWFGWGGDSNDDGSTTTDEAMTLSPSATSTNGTASSTSSSDGGWFWRRQTMI
ncbi:hypothetical protein JCM10212_000106 [Sporobolomyces blumeae]